MAVLFDRSRFGERWFVGLFFLVLLVPSVACAEESAPEVTLSLTPAALLHLLETVMPYRVELGNSLLKETLTFRDPKNVVLSKDQVTFAVRVQGTPFPLDQVLKPVLAIRKSTSGTYEIKVASLPMAIPGYGSMDLSEVFPPVSLQSLFEQRLDLQGKPLKADLKIQEIKIGPEQIELAAILRLIPLGMP